MERILQQVQYSHRLKGSFKFQKWATRVHAIGDTHSAPLETALLTRISAVGPCHGHESLALFLHIPDQERAVLGSRQLELQQL